MLVEWLKSLENNNSNIMGKTIRLKNESAQGVPENFAKKAIPTIRREPKMKPFTKKERI